MAPGGRRPEAIAGVGSFNSRHRQLGLLDTRCCVGAEEEDGAEAFGLRWTAGVLGEGAETGGEQWHMTKQELGARRHVEGVGAVVARIEEKWSWGLGLGLGR